MAIHTQYTYMDVQIYTIYVYGNDLVVANGVDDLLAIYVNGQRSLVVPHLLHLHHQS